MTTDQYLFERMRNVLMSHKVAWIEKKMFGGNCFMVDDKMCFGTYKGGLMVRIAPEEAEELLKRPSVEQMFMGAKQMVGYLLVEPAGYDSEEDLEFWLKKCLEFNPKAKSSKKH